jgi:hypothetical protein
MTLLIPLILLGFYTYLRKMWFQLRSIKTLAAIDRVELNLIGGIIAPEVSVEYTYTFHGRLYHGRGYVAIQDFFPEREFVLEMTPQGLPLLLLDGEEFVSEEHIETLLISQTSGIIVYVDPTEAFRTRIDTLNKSTSDVYQK